MYYKTPGNCHVSTFGNVIDAFTFDGGFERRVCTLRGWRTGYATQHLVSVMSDGRLAVRQEGTKSTEIELFVEPTTPSSCSLSIDSSCLTVTCRFKCGCTTVCMYVF